jgi:DNA replication protein DnaC
VNSKHLEELKVIRFENKQNCEINKYKTHSCVSSLNLSDQEFKRYLGVIVHMVKERELNQDDSLFYFTQLVRNEKGELQTVSMPNEKNCDLLQIKNHYLIHHFPNNLLKVLLNPKSIGSKVDVNKQKILKYYLSVIENPTSAAGLYVYGDVGVGKTYTAIALANELAKLENSIAFVNCADIAYKLKQGFGNEENTNDELVTKMRHADVLFVDDIGAEDEKV